MNGNQGRVAPVNVGDELEVTIEAVGSKGDGICKEKGFVLFVKDTQAGKHYKIKVTKVLEKVGFAEPVEELSSAPQRQEQPRQREPPRRREERAPSMDKKEENYDDLKGDDSEDFGEEEEPQEEGSKLPPPVGN